MQKQDHAPGETCWVTLATTDPQAVADFYQRLLGWNATWGDGEADMTLDAKPVARIAPVADGEPGWVMHIAVDDVEQSVARVVGAGGSVLVAPTAHSDAHRAGAGMAERVSSWPTISSGGSRPNLPLSTDGRHRSRASCG